MPNTAAPCIVMPPSHKTIPNVFIVESIKLEEEKKGLFEGQCLYNYLKLLGKEPIYYYVRTARELEQISFEFRQSRYRYLHLSCHGTGNSILTTLDEVNYIDFAKMYHKKLEHRRVFISGCWLGDELLAETLFGTNGGLYSLTAPTKVVFFQQMLPFWSTFYYMMNSVDENSMKGKILYQSLQTCCNIFNVEMAHFIKTPIDKNIKKKIFESESIFDEDTLAKAIGVEKGKDISM